jgi:hypothetical protein
MAVAEIRILADERVISRLQQIAAARHTDVGTLLGRVANAIAGESWRSIPIGPRTEAALGVAGTLPDRPDDELLSDALSDRFDRPR